jgi:hypothetical protein
MQYDVFPEQRKSKKHKRKKRAVYRKGGALRTIKVIKK